MLQYLFYLAYRLHDTVAIQRILYGRPGYSRNTGACPWRNLNGAISMEMIIEFHRNSISWEEIERFCPEELLPHLYFLNHTEPVTDGRERVEHYLIWAHPHKI